jgi:folate-binding protein YgfZ
VLGRAGAEVPALPPESHVAARVAGHDVRVCAASDLPGPALVLHVPAEAGAAVRAALAEAGAEPLSGEAFDVLRIEQGRPRYGVDVTEENLLHETGLVGEYHSGAKGCYVGQEVIARLEARGGNVNKRLRGLRLGAPAAAGATIRAEGQDVGRVTTAGVSPRLGPIAMGYVHRSRFEPGTPVEVDGAPAGVAELPLERP